MRILLIFSLIFVVASTTYLEDKRFPAQIDDDDSEIVIKDFNKCSKDQYYDLYTASCQKCIKCPKGKFALNECKKFDNTECASCSNKDYSNTRAYRANCRGFPVKSGAYTIRNGMRKIEPLDIEVPWNNIGESYVRDRRQDDVEFDDSIEIPDLPGNYDDEEVNAIMDSNDDDSSFVDDEYEEFYGGLDLSSEDFDELETVDAQIILPAARPIIDETGVLEVMAMSDDSSNSDESDSDSNADSESSESVEVRSPSEGKLKEVKKIIEKNLEKFKDASKRVVDDSEEDAIQVDDDDDEDDDDEDSTTKSYNFTESFKVWNLLTKFFVFIAYCFAVMSLFVAFRYAQNMRRQRTFNVQPIVMTPDQHYDLVRTVNYLQSKRRGPFKYEPLEEFV